MAHLELAKPGAEDKSAMATKILEFLDQMHDFEVVIRSEIRAPAKLLAPNETDKKALFTA